MAGTGSQPGPGRPTWAEIDLGALGRNASRIRERCADRRLIGVVKADAYGHGAPRIAAALVAVGYERLGVATFDEARELRESGIEVPILLLQGLHDPALAPEALALGLVPMVGSVDALEPLAAAARSAEGSAPLHLKLDVGMHRLGLQPEALSHALERVRASGGALVLEGVCSHLAEADDPASAATERQRRLFSELLASVRGAGFSPDWVHLDHSAGIAHGPTPGTTAVRPGLALYGADPTQEHAWPLEPVMTLVSRVTRVEDLAAGDRVGYGGAWIAERATRVLTLPIGYADGLPRAASGRFAPGVRGERRPLAGRVSMDLCAVDAGSPAGATAAGAGEEVLIFGRRADLTIRVEELADAAGTIAYEILVGIGARVPRVYV